MSEEQTVYGAHDPIDEFDVEIVLAEQRGVWVVVPDEEDLQEIEAQLEEQIVELEARRATIEDHSVETRLDIDIQMARRKIALARENALEMESRPDAQRHTYRCSPYGHMEAARMNARHSERDPKTGITYTNGELVNCELMTAHVHSCDGQRLTRAQAERLSAAVAGRLQREIRRRSQGSMDALFRDRSNHRRPAGEGAAGRARTDYVADPTGD